MFLISRLYHAVQSWCRRPGGPRAAKGANLSMEQLDHRQLLSVNFTGNVATDFPASTSPGVVVLPDNASVTHPVISDPALANLVKVSGFDINGLRVSYDAADDTLSIGIEQPLSQQPSHPGPVIAGDSDNNGNDGTVNPAVTALEGPGFKDFPDFGGSEFMAAFLDLKGAGFADVAAGYAINDPRSPKEYQVAQAVVNSSPPANAPDFGTSQVQQPGTVYTEVPGDEGNVYKVNSPAHPNLEFSITHFSQLYQQETGTALTPNSVIGLGATAGSGDDIGIGEAFFPEQKFTLSQATMPPMTCTVSPPVIINPHSNQTINTAHDTLIRVNILGSSGFNVAQIEPNTVTLGGAHPIFSFDHNINKDNWPDATFVFKADQVNLPAGKTEATVTGELTTGLTFSSSVLVTNKTSASYNASAVSGAEARQSARSAAGIEVPPTSPVTVSGTTVALKKPAYPANSPNGQLVQSTLKVDYTTPSSLSISAASLKSQPKLAGKVVKIKARDTTTQSNVPRSLQKSLDHFVRQVGAVNVGTGAVIPSGGVSKKLVRQVGAVVLNTDQAIGPGVASASSVRQSGAVNLTSGTSIGAGAV